MKKLRYFLFRRHEVCDESDLQISFVHSRQVKFYTGIRSYNFILFESLNENDTYFSALITNHFSGTTNVNRVI